MAMESLILGADHEQVEIAFRTSEASAQHDYQPGRIDTAENPDVVVLLNFLSDIAHGAPSRTLRFRTDRQKLCLF